MTKYLNTNQNNWTTEKIQLWGTLRDNHNADLPVSSVWELGGES